MAVIERLFDAARQQLTNGVADNLQPVAQSALATPREEEIRAAALAWFHTRNRADAQEAYAAFNPAPGTPYDPSRLSPDEARDEAIIDESELSGPDGLRDAERFAISALAAFGFRMPTGELRSTAIALFQRALVEGAHRAQLRWGGLVVERPRDELFAPIMASSPRPASPAPRPAELTFRGLCDAYVAAPERSGLAPKSHLKYRGFNRVLSSLIGDDTPASAVTREVCRRVQSDLGALPANAVQRYPGLDAQAAVAIATRDGVPPMHPKSVGNYLDYLAAIFSWGIRERVVRLPDGNPAEGLNRATTQNVTAGRVAARRPFKTEELQAIFSAPLYTGCQDDERGYADIGPQHPRRGRFWVPLIGLFEGLRLNEACQLRTDDIHEIDGITVIHVRAGAEGQQLKTMAAERQVPVHPELARIGFVRFAAQQRGAGHVRLFPDLASGKMGNYSDPFSKWFARFSTKAGVTERSAVYHSFRHGFRDRLREKEVPRDLAEALGGWKSVGTSSAYGNGYSVRMLTDHLSRIDYPGLDLSGLYPTHQD